MKERISIYASPKAVKAFRQLCKGFRISQGELFEAMVGVVGLQGVGEVLSQRQAQYLDTVADTEIMSKKEGQNE